MGLVGQLRRNIACNICGRPLLGDSPTAGNSLIAVMVAAKMWPRRAEANGAPEHLAKNAVKGSVT